MTREGIEHVASLGFVLSARARVGVLRELLACDAGVSMSALADRAKLKLATVSHHVAILKSRGFVCVEAEGREKLVSVSPSWWTLLSGVFDGVEASGEGEGDEDDEGARE